MVDDNIERDERELRDLVRAAIRRLGVPETARRLQLAPVTTLRLAGPSAVQRGTVALAQRNVGRLSDTATTAA